MTVPRNASIDRTQLYTMRNTTPIQIRFNDVDLARHVHNAVYLQYFELGRMDLLRKFIPKDHDWTRTGLILARNEVDYRIPIQLSDAVQVETWCGRIGAKSFDLHYAVCSTEDERIFAEGRSVMVCFNYNEQRSFELPEAWREALARMMENE